MAAESSWHADVHKLQYGMPGDVSSASTSAGFSILLPHKYGTGSFQRLNDTTRLPMRQTCLDAGIEVATSHAKEHQLHANATHNSKEMRVDGRLQVEYLPEVYIAQNGIVRNSSTRSRVHLPILQLGPLPLGSGEAIPTPPRATTRSSSPVSSRSSSSKSVLSQPAPSAPPLTESSSSSAPKIRDQNLFLTRASLRHLQAAAQACTSGTLKRHGSAASMASFPVPPVWAPFAPINGDANKEEVPDEVTPWTKEKDLANKRQLSSGGLESSKRGVQRHDAGSTWEIGPS